METEVYLEYLQTDFDFITYEIYCDAFDLAMTNQLTEGFFDDLKQARLTGKLVQMFRDLKYNLSKISKEFKKRAHAVKPFYTRDPKKAAQFIIKRLTSEMKPVLKKFAEKREKANDVIDTNEAYAETQAKCNDW